MQSTEITNEIGNGPSLQIEEPTPVDSLGCVPRFFFSFLEHRIVGVAWFGIGCYSMSYFIRCSWSAGPLRIPFRLGKKITMSKGRRVAERRLWEHTDGEWPASICAAVHVPRKFCRSFSESYPDIPGRKQKRHLGSRAGSDEWWQIGSTVAIAGPPGNLSLGRQDNRSLV